MQQPRDWLSPDRLQLNAAASRPFKKRYLHVGLATEQLRCSPLDLGSPGQQLEQSEFEALDELCHEYKPKVSRQKPVSVVISFSLCMDRPCVRKKLLEMKRLGLRTKPIRGRDLSPGCSRRRYGRGWELVPLMQEQGVGDEEAALSLGTSGLKTFSSLGFGGFWQIVTEPRTLAARRRADREAWRFAGNRRSRHDP